MISPNKCVIWFVLMVVTGSLFGQTTEPTTNPTVRSVAEILSDVKAAEAQLRQLLQPPLSFFDPAGRQALAKTEVPTIVRRLGRLNEERLAAGGITPAVAERLRRRDRLWLALAGDTAALTELESAAHSSDLNQALAALSDLLLIAMSDHASDQAARIRDVDALEKLVRTHPTSPSFFFVLEWIALSNLPRDTETRRRLMPVLQIQQTDEARELARQAQSCLVRAELVGQPMHLEAKTVNGESFKLATLKGKVVLVEFWATWCPSCIAELPEVKVLYDKYHQQGLEVVGVSCDKSLADLNAFLKENHDITWPQIIDRKDLDGRRIFDKLGIYSIPTIFLIDRQGIVRSTERQEKLDEQISILLAEK